MIQSSRSAVYGIMSSCRTIVNQENWKRVRGIGYPGICMGQLTTANFRAKNRMQGPPIMEQEW
jgi:hypothetical protein